MAKHKPEEYKHIRTWGQMMGSHDYYIKLEQAQAAEDDAPIDAIYEKGGVAGAHTGIWICASDLTPDHSFHELHKLATECDD